MTVSAILIALAAANETDERCSATSPATAHIQWSEPAKFVSPDHQWEIEVKPNFSSNDNETPVTIRRCGRSKSQPLFTLQRMANIYWSPAGDDLLIINEPVDNRDEGILIRLHEINSKKARSRNINDTILQNAQQMLTYSRSIVFYYLRLLSWGDGYLKLSVGGANTLGLYGPMTPYCFGINIDTQTFQVRSMEPVKQLGMSIDANCKISP